MKKDAFTLIELLVVVTIVAVLSAVGMVVFTNAGKSSRDAKRKADLESIRQALVLYRDDNGCYPSSSIGVGRTYLDMSTGAPLTDSGYIGRPFPKDPQSPDKNYIYSTTSYSSINCKDGSEGSSGFSLSATMENEQEGGGFTYEISSP